MVNSQVRLCPKGDLCSINANGERGLMKFRDKAGFTNPFNHIKKCCFSDDKSIMIDAYWEAKVGTKIQSNLGVFFQLPTKSPGASIIRTKKDNELFDFHHPHPSSITPTHTPLLASMSQSPVHHHTLPLILFLPMSQHY
jgi:hypothetical protein